MLATNSIRFFLVAPALRGNPCLMFRAEPGDRARSAWRSGSTRRGGARGFYPTWNPTFCPAPTNPRRKPSTNNSTNTRIRAVLGRGNPRSTRLHTIPGVVWRLLTAQLGDAYVNSWRAQLARMLRLRIIRGRLSPAMRFRTLSLQYESVAKRSFALSWCAAPPKSVPFRGSLAVASPLLGRTLCVLQLSS